MLKSEALTVRPVMGAYSSLFRKKIKLRDPTCDVSCISTNIQHGGQLNIFNQNMSQKEEVEKKFCYRLPCIVLQPLSNETIKIFLAVSLEEKNFTPL